MSLNIFENIDTLSLFLLFLIPGFISIRVYDTLIPGENRDYSKSLVELIGYSTLNFILLSPLIYWMSIAVWWVQWILLIALVILFPILWPLVIIWLLGGEKARFWIEKIPLIKHTLGRTREPFRTSWDWVFSQRRKYWVVVTLKNGKKYGGKMSSKSYASSYPPNYQIYIEETWEVDENGEFTGEQKENACGVLIVSDEIEAIEFFD